MKQNYETTVKSIQNPDGPKLCWSEQSGMKLIEKDGLYALPYESVPNLMFVNKTLLQQMGIETPDSDWSWEDFYKICESIRLHNESSENQLYGYVGYQWI